jgi:hypothetical protein
MNKIETMLRLQQELNDTTNGANGTGFISSMI